ncbi:hypothetical protein NDU88_000858 [Pleurodeles waltl]|uniref:Uncharacterized protein n=1 Tax=Pleurodeles waltl TaxID=8319 RepID=A0AAV7Q1G5_PLEWA|nr:hypothetical protein NDU88_000858 [Pleurodeles waltl]
MFGPSRKQEQRSAALPKGEQGALTWALPDKRLSGAERCKYENLARRNRSYSSWCLTPGWRPLTQQTGIKNN